MFEWEKSGKLTVSGELLHYYYTFIFYLFCETPALVFFLLWESSSRGALTITYTWHIYPHTLSFFLTFTFTATWERFSAYDLWFLWYKFRFTLLPCLETLLLLDAYAMTRASFCFFYFCEFLQEPLLCTLSRSFFLAEGKHSKHKTSTRRYYLWAVFIIILPNSLIFSTTLSNMGIQCVFLGCFSPLDHFLFHGGETAHNSSNTHTHTPSPEVFLAFLRWYCYCNYY